MSYGNEYSNKPFEKASKTGHTNIINDPEVKEFLSRCKIPPFKDDVDGEDIQNIFLEDTRENPIKNSTFAAQIRQISPDATG